MPFFSFVDVVLYVHAIGVLECRQTEWEALVGQRLNRLYMFPKLLLGDQVMPQGDFYPTNEVDSERRMCMCMSYLVAFLYRREDEADKTDH